MVLRCYPPETFADPFVCRFFFKPEPYARLVLPTILKLKDGYGFNSALGLEDPSDPASTRMKMLVEYSSPNIAKEFHTGHLRSTIIGGFLVKLYEKAGWNTVSMNYLGTFTDAEVEAPFVGLIYC